jgi:hypothetical protein|tara:strand:+ start:682 stop:855 length:174 start_codon:yes stop_codon:yes gene_type:complete
MPLFSEEVKIVDFADLLIQVLKFSVTVRTSFAQGHTKIKYSNYDNLLLQTQALEKKT